MRPGALLATLSLCYAVAIPGVATETADSSTLHVMLQGESAASLGELVLQNGGRITHQLPIINAVGAELSRAQLDTILETGRVSRHIDDLSITDQPENETPADENECDVGGAVEIRLDTDGYSWQLYNRNPEPARLNQLTLSWPPALGKIRSISLGEATIATEAMKRADAGKVDIVLPEESKVQLKGSQPLRIQFSQANTSQLQQRDFTATAIFAGNCETELIPGYRDNDENFYYATAVGADSLHQHGIRGGGVTVVVLDSGLWEHKALANDTRGKNRILARYDAIADATTAEAFDESGHGTHLTSVIAHSGETTYAGRGNGTYKGIAPDANLVAVKAFNVEGQGGMLDIVRGVQWVVENRETYNIRVLNLSFAARPRWPYWLDPINQAVMRAWAAGIVVVAAAGNEGPEPMTIGSPGNLPYIITVGAITDSWTIGTRDDDYIPDFSSRGPTPDAHIKPDIVAPGGHITGIIRPGSGLTQEHPEYMLGKGDFVMTGSSQASALVSGVIALLLQLEPELTPDDVKCKLLSSAEPAINRDGLLAYTPFQQGHGYVSATRAITLGETGCGNADMDLQKDIAMEEHFEGPAIVEENGKISLPDLHELLSPAEAAKGMSDSRVWGVKEHVERLTPVPEATTSHPFNWRQMYLDEKAKIEKLASEPAS